MAFNDPSAGTPQEQPSGVPQSDDLSSRWSQWIDKPANRAAMMQFGIAMLQPMMPGENVISHAAASMGSGGEAAERVAEQGRQERLASDKSELMGAQAQLAGSRSENAGLGATIREQAARNQEERTRLLQEQGGFTRQRQLYSDYNKAKSEHELLNGPGSFTDDFPTWAARGGLDLGTRPQPTTPTKPSTEMLVQRRADRISALRDLATRDPKQAKAALDALAQTVADPPKLYAMFPELAKVK